VRTAVDPVAGLNAMPDDLARAVEALWGERVNRTLEAIECERFAIHGDIEAGGVLVSTMITLGHAAALARAVPAAFAPGYGLSAGVTAGFRAACIPCISKAAHPASRARRRLPHPQAEDSIHPANR